MTLLSRYLLEERAEIMEQKIRFTTIGRRTDLPDNVLSEINENIRVSQNNPGMVLCLAINYGGRTELVDADRQLAERVERGELNYADIDEAKLARSLYTAGYPIPICSFARPAK
jgi:undecaprenyl diphosphate synthase